MDFIVPHEVTYDFDGRATVSEVAKALVAQDRLFREAMRVIEACFPDLDVEQLTVTVREVTQNSPMRHRLEGFVIAALSPGLGDDMPVDILNTLFGVDVPDSWDSFVSIIIILISMWGAERFVALIKRGKKDAERAKAEASENVLAIERRRLTESAADRAFIPVSQLSEALNEVLSKREASVRKASMDFLAPAKRHHARSIAISGGPAISEEVIRALPSDVEIALFQPPTETYPLDDVIVAFHAHDKDRPKHWAAMISEVSRDRKPLHLAPDIRPEELFVKTQVRADVLVTSVLDADGDYVPSIYYLSKVYDDIAA